MFPLSSKSEFAKYNLLPFNICINPSDPLLLEQEKEKDYFKYCSLFIRNVLNMNNT